MSELKATIDFETRSLRDLKTVGAYVYASDPSTSVLCMAYHIPGEAVRLWLPTEPFPRELIEWVLKPGLVEAHNAGFEWCIWNLCLSRTQKIPTLYRSQLRCSAAKAAALALPRSLEGLAQALGSDVQKDMAGRRAMLKLSKPRKPTAKDKSLWHEGSADYLTMYQYCMNDVATEMEVSAMMPELSPDEQDLWELTEEINERGIFCDVPLIKNAISFIEKNESELLAEFSALTGGEVATVKQVEKFRSYLEREHGVVLPDLSAATVADALKKELPSEARRLLEIRRLLAKSSVGKFKAMLNMAGADSRVRGTLLYHGASTGRFASRGIQTQNFIKATVKDVNNIYDALAEGDYEWFKTIFPDVLSALASALRGMLKAAPGRELFAGDFSAIEARVLLWLARDEKNLKLWRDGKDVYKVMAADIYGVDVGDVTHAQRDMGKRAILGAGYGMGPDKFVITCEAQGGVIISKDFASRVITAYRERHAAVTRFWRDVEDAAKNAVRFPGQVFKVGYLSFKVAQKFLWIKLPSGRKLAYREPVLKTGMTKFGVREELRFMAVGKNNKWLSEATYGGKLVENITQAVARDIMVNSMFNLDIAKYRPIMTVHDEIVSERVKGMGDLKEFERIMAELPAWAPGLPLAVGAWQGERYRK